MSSSNIITVKGLGPAVTEVQISDFFSFCGKVSKVTLSPSNDGNNSATVEFAKPAAIKTAVLLTDSELGGHRVTVEATPDALAASEKDALAHSSENSSGVTGGTSSGGRQSPDDDIGQEYKPRAAILAEYLSHGYVLGDKVVAQGLELDQKHGISQRFTSFLTDLDKKYHIQDKAVATDSAYGITDRLAQGHAKASKYLDQALSTDTGSKVRSYYTDIVKNVNDVHAEARRLADIKKQQEEQKTAGSTTAPPTSSATGSGSAPSAPPAYEKS